MKKLLLAAMIAAALAGCTSFPEDYEKPTAATDVVAQMRDVWSSTPSVTRVASKAGISVRKFNDVPDILRAKPVSLSLEPGAALNITELVSALRAQGVKVASSLKDSAKTEVAASFNGDLGSLLDQLAAEHNIAYEYRNDVLFLTEAARFVVTLPQHEDFLKQVQASVTEMGGTNVRGDVRAGRLYYSAKPDVAQYLQEYISQIARNSAMVSLQVAVITVRLTRDVNLGLDWSKMQVGGGRGDLAPGITPLTAPTTNTGAGSGTSGGTNGSNGSTGSSGTAGTNGATSGSAGTAAAVGGAVGAAADAAVKLGSVLSLTGGEGLAYKFASNSFSLSAAITALSTYGSARTEQNVVMGTLSGLPVKIGSGNEIPYVKSIGSSTASGGATSGSSQTEIVKSGLTLEVTPSFEADDMSVVTTMKVDMSSLVGFRELSAGQNLGTMSQPEMQKLEFSNVGRLTAGDTLVVGGITYDQLNNNYTNFPGMEKYNTGSKSEKTSRFAVYIVVRPTVTIFEAEPEVAAKPGLPTIGVTPRPLPVAPVGAIGPAPLTRPLDMAAPFDAAIAAAAHRARTGGPAINTAPAAPQVAPPTTVTRPVVRPKAPAKPVAAPAAAPVASPVAAPVGMEPAAAAAAYRSRAPAPLAPAPRAAATPAPVVIPPAAAPKVNPAPGAVAPVVNAQGVR